MSLNGLAAEQTQTFTLKDAILIALRFNPNVRSAELQRVVDRFELEVAKNDFELHYALTGSSQYQHQRSDGINSIDKSLAITPSASILSPSGAQLSLEIPNKVGSDYYNPGITLTLKQPLLQGFGREITLNPLADARDRERINRLELKHTIIHTITTIISDYLGIVQAQNSLMTQELALKHSMKEYEQNKLRIKAGKMAAGDNVQQQASIANQRLALLQAQNNLDQNKQRLLLDMGLAPNTPFNIVKGVTLPNMTLPTLSTAQRLMLSNDRDYQTALINRGIQTRSLATAKDKLRWKLDLTTTIGNTRNAGLANNQNYRGSVQLDLTVPIDDKKLQQGVLNAKIGLQKMDIQLQQKRYTLETNVINALRDLEVQQQQIQQSIIARDLAQHSLDIALKKLQFGLVSTFETTSLRTNLTNAELQVINNQVSYLNALANFQQALGISLEAWEITVRY